MVYIGVDLGGTNIKAGVVDEAYTILATADRPTLPKRGPQAVCDDMALCIAEAVQAAGVDKSEVAGLGIGCPGAVDPAKGLVVYSNNLNWHEFPIVEEMHRRTGFSTTLGNDANVAALGEVAAGCAKGAQSAVIITLGTGVGSGVVLEGEILTGYGGGASEIGHIVIEADGHPCTCGRKGCFESYCSATGLIRMTKEAVAQYPESRLAAIAKERGTVNGLTAFDAMREGDETGKAVVDKYLQYLVCGLTNVVNIFQPEVIALSGGISKEGEVILGPIRAGVEKEMFGGPGTRMTRFEICTLGYRAGLIGAAQLAKIAHQGAAA